MQTSSAEIVLGLCGCSWSSEHEFCFDCPCKDLTSGDGAVVFVGLFGGTSMLLPGIEAGECSCEWGGEGVAVGV